MSTQVVFGELDEGCGWRFASVREELAVDMGAQVLDAYFAISSFWRRFGFADVSWLRGLEWGGAIGERGG